MASTWEIFEVAQKVFGADTNTRLKEKLAGLEGEGWQIFTVCGYFSGPPGGRLVYEIVCRKP